MRINLSRAARHAAFVFAFVAALQPSPSPSPSPSPQPGELPYDMQAIGATVRAKIGSTVKITVGMRNNGPGTSHGSGGPMLGTVHHLMVIKMPSGSEVTEMSTPLPPPLGCYGTTEIYCKMAPLAAGQTLMVTMVVRVDSARRDTPGSITRELSRAIDTQTNHANDTAPIVIDTRATLPQTGPNTAGLVAGGLATIAAGVLLLFVLRRRWTVRPTDSL